MLFWYFSWHLFELGYIKPLLTKWFYNDSLFWTDCRWHDKYLFTTFPQITHDKTAVIHATLKAIYIWLAEINVVGGNWLDATVGAPSNQEEWVLKYIHTYRANITHANKNVSKSQIKVTYLLEISNVSLRKKHSLLAITKSKVYSLNRESV